MASQMGRVFVKGTIPNVGIKAARICRCERDLRTSSKPLRTVIGESLDRENPIDRP